MYQNSQATCKEERSRGVIHAALKLMNGGVDYYLPPVKPFHSVIPLDQKKKEMKGSLLRSK